MAMKTFFIITLLLLVPLAYGEEQTTQTSDSSIWERGKSFLITGDDFESCTDSDEKLGNLGINPYEKGEVVWGITNQVYEDDCLLEQHLTEYSCQNGNVQKTLGTCNFGCSDGRCFMESEVPVPPTISCPEGYEKEGEGTCKLVEGSQLTDENGTITGCMKEGKIYGLGEKICDRGVSWWCRGVWQTEKCYESGKACKEGECIEPKCVDSDNGIDVEKEGTVTGLDENGEYSISDYCIMDENYNLVEYSCENNMRKLELVKCPSGCSEGVCNPPLLTEPIGLPAAEKSLIQKIIDFFWKIFGLANLGLQAVPGTTACQNPPGHNPAITGSGDSEDYYKNIIHSVLWPILHGAATDEEKKQAAYYSAKKEALLGCANTKCEMPACFPIFSFEEFDPSHLASKPNATFGYSGIGECNCGKSSLSETNTRRIPQYEELPDNLLKGNNLPVLNINQYCSIRTDISYNILKQPGMTKKIREGAEKIKTLFGYSGIVSYTNTNPVSVEHQWDNNWNSESKANAKNEAFKQALRLSANYCNTIIKEAGGCKKIEEHPFQCSEGFISAFTFGQFDLFTEIGAMEAPFIGSCSTDPLQTCIKYSVPGTCDCFPSDAAVLKKCQGEAGIESAVRGECNRIIFG